MVLFAIIKKVLFWWIQNKGSQGEMGWLGFQQFWCLQKSPAVDKHRREQYLVSRGGNEGGLTVWINCFRQTNISLGRDQHHQQHQNRHGCLGSFQIFILTYISNLQSIIWGSDDANRAIRGNMAVPVAPPGGQICKYEQMTHTDTISHLKLKLWICCLFLFKTYPQIEKVNSSFS